MLQLQIIATKIILKNYKIYTCLDDGTTSVSYNVALKCSRGPSSWTDIVFVICELVVFFSRLFDK